MALGDTHPPPTLDFQRMGHAERIAVAVASASAPFNGQCFELLVVDGGKLGWRRYGCHVEKLTRPKDARMAINTWQILEAV